MQEILLVLVLMGQCSFITCQLYKYHFINERKTWTEAQTYCREKYTDLARVSDMEEVERLCGPETVDEAWIGLHHTNSTTWIWSLPGTEVIGPSDGAWADNEPNVIDTENCVVMDEGKWRDYPCDCNQPFFCYNKTNDEFHLINENMTWYQAQKFCRENHTDLISGTQNTQQQQVQHFWIGLFRDSWTWSDGRPWSFRNWCQDDKSPNDGKCAVTRKDGTWMKKDCNQEKPFFCYDDGLILIRENKTWEEALSHCREHHCDLVSILNLQQHQWVQGLAKKANSTHVWLGVRYTCTLGFWFWITDEKVDYTSWNSTEEVNECGKSGAMETGGQQKWFKKFDVEKFNFICFKN